LDRNREAEALHRRNLSNDAEYHYRIAGLYYNLLQWLFPSTGDEKRKWFARCKEMFKHADRLSEDHIIDVSVQIAENHCFGRIHEPIMPKGCVVIINPIDSSKEELFTYEMDFANKGFVTVSFDGPGQGETYVVNEGKATRQNWRAFVNGVIDYSAAKYPELDIYLFGTSSGAAWALEGSLHPKVSKAVAVSPACKNEMKLPDYFLERMSYWLDDLDDGFLPQPDHLSLAGPILLFHGNKDVMVKDEDIYHLFNKLRSGSRLIEYEDEGHCCNFKLAEIRGKSAMWYLEG
jgi:pimeloyl-ACP methyl ester carboxylesterase